MSRSFSLSNSKDLDPLMERIGEAKVVMLGEASHGTHEYYTWRTAITKRLITEKGFRFIGVEGDWPDCYRINRYIKGFEHNDKSPEYILKNFNRWPTWMWANWEVTALLTWLKDHNSRLSGANKKIGFYGLDVYSLWESMEALITYLKKTDPEALHIVEKALDCFAVTGNNEKRYAYASLSSPCKEKVIELLKEIRLKAPNYNHDSEASLNTVQNAHIAVEAEKYYRNMMSFDDNTWNIRDKHMMDTLDRLFEFHEDSKAIVWAHNTHVGDARYTDMKKAGMFNIGQLAREKYGEGNVVITGFGSYGGKVIAGDDWGEPMKEMKVPEGKPGSLEEIYHSEFNSDRLIIFDKHDAEKPEITPHRAIGVVYDPKNERNNYVPSLVEKRYDAFIFIDETKALHPLHIKPDLSQVPETFPFEF